MIITALVGVVMLVVAGAVGLTVLLVMGAGTAALAGAAATMGMRGLEVVSGRRIRRKWDVPVITVHWHEPHFQAEPAGYWEFESFLFHHPELQDIDVEEAATAGFNATRGPRHGSGDLAWDSDLPKQGEFESYFMDEPVAS
jgi:hypothetical protein